jgi:hypothetical protein
MWDGIVIGLLTGLLLGLLLGLWAGNYICATGGWVRGF